MPELLARKKLNKLQVIKTYSISSKNSCLVCILSILLIPGVVLGQCTGALLLPPTKNVVSIYETKRSKSVNLVVVVVSSPFSRGIWPPFFDFQFGDQSFDRGFRTA